MKYFRLSVVLLSLFLYPGLTFSSKEQGKTAPREEKVTVEDVLPLTVGNLRGHNMLYNEGWRVITSSNKALDFAKKTSLVTSKIAIQEAIAEQSKFASEYKDLMKAGGDEGQAADNGELK